MIRDRIHVLPLASLTLAWVLLWGNVSWANVLGGLVLGSLVLLVFPLPRLVTQVRLRPMRFLVLFLLFNRDLFVASAQVAWQAVTRARRTTGVLIPVQLRGRDHLLLTLTAEMVALVPGTVVIDLDADEGVLLVHALDVRVDDGEAILRVRRSIRAQEQRVLDALAEDPTCSEVVS